MDEIHELDRLREYNLYDINLDFANVTSKVICLIQANISNAIIRVSSLASDCQYIMQVRYIVSLVYRYYMSLHCPRR